MSSSVLQQYEQAMQQKRQAEALIAVLKKPAMEEVRQLGSVENDGSRVKYNGNSGNFTLTKYKVYIYSPAVTKAEEALKQLKIKEIKENIAQIEEKEMFMFKQKSQ